MPGIRSPRAARRREAVVPGAVSAAGRIRAHPGGSRHADVGGVGRDRAEFDGADDDDFCCDVGARRSALLIYDADCGFCQRSLDVGRRLLPWTPAAVGFQHVDVSRYGLTDAQARQSIQLCQPGRSTRHGADAVATILQAQPVRPWRVAGYVLATPPISWIAAGCYRLVSRYRHRLPGSTCRAPAPPDNAG